MGGWLPVEFAADSADEGLFVGNEFSEFVNESFRVSGGRCRSGIPIDTEDLR